LQLLQILIFTAHYYAVPNIPPCQPHHESLSDSYRDCFPNSRKVDLATVDSTLPHIRAYQLREFLYPRRKNLRVQSGVLMCCHCILNAKCRNSRGNL